MVKKSNQDFLFRKIYPNMRYLLGFGRKVYRILSKLQTAFSRRPASSSVLPDSYTVCNTDTINSEFTLDIFSGSYPEDISGSLFIDQCLGVPGAFMVGDSNIVRLDFSGTEVNIKNRLLWTPASMARIALEDSPHHFDFMGLMYMSPGLGIFSYTEGMYLLPDGRIAVTSDVDRPWIIDRDELRAQTPLGRREEWAPMFKESAGDVMGNLFAGYNNSHVIYSDVKTDEVFLANFQYRQTDGDHPVYLSCWKGEKDLERWLVVDEKGDQIEIKQSIHELVFTKDFILMADTAFIAGTEMMLPWRNAPLPNNKTIIHIVDRRDLKKGFDTVKAVSVEVDEPCIHLIPEYDNLNDRITVYMLHTPATNTAEILHENDRDLNGNLFPEKLTGYGTLPVLDLSSVGKHIIDVKKEEVVNSTYISEMPYTWGPYLYAYMGRQSEVFNGQDLFIMFKGFSKDMLPERIYNAYKDVDKRRIPIEKMIDGEGMHHNNSICRITTGDFAIADSYVFPDRVLLYTIACLDSTEKTGAGYVIAGVATDEYVKESSGHEYWIFKADDLAAGPVCRMGHKDLNNSTLFHTVFIPDSLKEKWNDKNDHYNISLREDYPGEELKKWDPKVLETFREQIWPYFDIEDPEAQVNATQATRYLSTQRIQEHAGTEYIIGEEPVVDAALFADKMAKEAMRMWMTSGWKTEKEKKGILVESKPVSGDFADSGILVMRSRGFIDAPASTVFDLLTSPEGYAILDPVSKPEDHLKPPIETFRWKEGTRLEAALAVSEIPVMPKAEFVVLNAIDPGRKIFVSKSIIHPDHPGASIYYSGSEEYAVDKRPGKKVIRALNTMAIMATPVSENLCELLILNYVDMSAKKGQGAGLYNLINRNFFNPLYSRIEKYLKI